MGVPLVLKEGVKGNTEKVANALKVVLDLYLLHGSGANLCREGVKRRPHNRPVWKGNLPFPSDSHASLFRKTRHQFVTKTDPYAGLFGAIEKRKSKAGKGF